MEEKKLTDEEVLKVLMCCYAEGSCEECPLTLQDLPCNTDMYEQLLNLIQRLQSENERLKDEKEEIKLFNLAIQNGEVDMRIESEMAKSFYNSIVQVFEQNGAKNFFTTTIDIEGKKGRYAFTIEKVGGQTVAEKLAEQKAEIERLTKLAELRLRDNEDTCKLLMEKEKQVDELTEERENMQVEIIATEEARLQAVKDTAKEILQGLIDKAYVNECIDLTVTEVKAWFREDYGVEVE